MICIKVFLIAWSIWKAGQGEDQIEWLVLAGVMTATTRLIYWPIFKAWWDYWRRDD